MLHLALLQVAEEAAEPSKVPFYVAGGAFAAWAVVLFLIGMRNPDFPGGQGAARGVITISAVLMAGAMVTAVITA